MVRAGGPYRSGVRILPVVLALLLLLLPTAASAGNGVPSAPRAPLTTDRPPTAASPALAGALGGALPRPAAVAFDWGLAYILYGPNDDTTHFMGEGAAMVVDNHLRNITVFGGEGSGGLTNETFDYNYSTGNIAVNVLTPGPSPRANMSFAAVPGHDFAVLFGGVTDIRTDAATNDTWVYYFANHTWRNVTHGLAPPPRESAAFAANGSGASAILEGGWDPHYAVNASSASVIWNDTWSLNLTTFTWTVLHPRVAPAPMFGSSMIWQDATDTYLLFGGCALACSRDLWTFGGSPASWRMIDFGGAPSPRAASTFAWDELDQVAVVFGGFDWGPEGAVALGDGFYFAPASNAWTSLVASGGPEPKYDAPSAWAQFPGCVGLIVVGGSPSLLAPPGNASVLEPINALQPNCFPDLISGGGPPPPPCSVAQVPLDLFVYDNFTGLGVPNATVNVDGGCVHRTTTTNAEGYLNLSIPAPDRLNLTANAPGYRPDGFRAEFLPNTTNRIRIPLGPFPSLHLRAWGEDAYGSDPLGGVRVAQSGTLILGTTNAAGYLNVSRIDAPSGTIVLSGSAANYSVGSSTYPVPYSGWLFANVTLRAASDLDIHFVDAVTQASVPGATGALVDLDPGAGPPIPIAASASGWWNLSRFPAENVSVTANASGYLTNTSYASHGWVVPTVLIVPLRPKVGAVLDVHVLDAERHIGVPHALVTVLGLPTETTSSAGWANFTNVRPAGLYEVSVGASGYRSNVSWVPLTYYQVVDPYNVSLVPIGGCLPGSACSTTPPAPPASFGFLNGGGGATVFVLIGAPLALLALGVAYVAATSRRPTLPAARGVSPARRVPP